MTLTSLLARLRSTRLLLLVDALLCCAVIYFVPYTEIDWRAYMQEVEGFLGGDFVYTNLRGDTGPLVYPAGFVYIFSALYYLTEKGNNILVAQVCFAVFYLMLVAVVFRIYNSCRLPFAATASLIISKRIHSIFLLRMFNDGIAMLLCYIAVLWLMKRKWTIGCVFYSLAVSVKMNVLLFSPGLLAVLVYMHPAGGRSHFFLGTAWCVGVCAAIQLLLGAPFLFTDPSAYMGRAFELGRVFTYRWSVNFQFVPEEIFVATWFGKSLLLATVVCWGIVAFRRWGPRLTRASNLLRVENLRRKRFIKEQVEARRGAPTATPEDRANLAVSLFRTSVEERKTQATVEAEVSLAIVQTLFEANMIGFCLSRSMHYQFFAWAFHQLPFLLWTSVDARFPQILKWAIFAIFEWAFNTYPATYGSSAMLVFAVLVPVLLGILKCHDAWRVVEIRQEAKVRKELLQRAYATRDALRTG